MTSNSEAQRRADRLVAQEVNACMSSLVATLSNATDNCADKELNALAWRATELATPVLDYESAAKEPDEEGLVWTDEAMRSAGYHSWQEVCKDEGIEPHELEVYEHWAVSAWLAEKLIAKGERVDTDFAGLNVWARTTTGQAIAADAVIFEIAADLEA